MRLGLATLLLGLVGWIPTSSGDEIDEKLAQRMEKLDVQFLKTLVQLAQKLDEAKDPEAAHFLASCAIGFGSKDPGLHPIKAGWEVSVFLGKARGGEALKDPNAIDTALRGSAIEYKKSLDTVLAAAKKLDATLRPRNQIHQLAIRYEIARGAHEYIQAIQRFNALRRDMGLRALLWDFAESQRLISLAWYMADTADVELNNLDKEKLQYAEGLENVAKKVAWLRTATLKETAEHLRASGLARQYMLNPNARMLWLGHWRSGRELDLISAYAVPLLPYRNDIPTPSAKYDRATVVKDWVDTEELVEINGKKVPLVRYPYSNEMDAPWAFLNGSKGQEVGWSSAELRFLETAGLPIMIKFFTDGLISDFDAQLAKNDSKEECRVYLNGDKRVELDPSFATALIVPAKQLTKGTTYTISIKCKVKDTPFEKTWSFTTRSK